MINTLGYAAMTAALAAVMVGMGTAWLSVRRNDWNLARTTRAAAGVQFVMVLVASLVLERAFLANDFSVRFVYETSSTDLPLLYKITAFWGGMDGSLLFWELVLSAYTLFIVFRHPANSRETLPYVLFTLGLIHLFLLGLLVSYSNPLKPMLPVPMEGRGLNPLLQHPAMAFHPPALYLGYIGLAVPFAYAMSSLAMRRLDNDWVTTTRRWTLTSWYFLSVGQMLGGEWAYEELGWGGFWAWDPVENAAFMPWTMATAFLHSIMIQEKRNMMKVWNMVLIIMAFALSILGTFIVRSGVINSVHAFAQSEVGPWFLVFLAVMMTGAFLLMFNRIQLLSSRHTAEHLLSKESTFLLNNLLFVGIGFSVFLGTVFPLLAEAVRGTKLSIQAPFFNTLVTPMGVLLLLLVGVCTLIAWRMSSWESMVKNFRWPTLAGVAVLVLLLALGMRKGWGLAIFASAAFTTAALGMDYARAVRVRKSQQGMGWGQAAITTIGRNRQRYGGMIVHLAVVLMFIGFAGKMFSTDTAISMAQGESTQVGAYKLHFKELAERQERNVNLQGAVVEVYKNDRLVEVMFPAKSFYPGRPEPLTEVAIYRNLWEDLYLVLSGVNENGSVTLKIMINPLIMGAWMGLPLFTLGFLVAVSYRPKTLGAGGKEKTS
ncbi:MAG: heme lyase CcmF/NrfE family subunit [Deltaproteobacteria bacterium]|nr:heme lyase CcmF/NrfE family subunit [Deltaproteobacteria bacterium]